VTSPAVEGVGGIGMAPPLGTIGGFGTDGDAVERSPEGLGSNESE
jgi:hypothetical protein